MEERERERERAKKGEKIENIERGEVEERDLICQKASNASMGKCR